MSFNILDNRNNTDLQKGNFATLQAVRGMQFGREVYSTVIKFKDLSDFLEVFEKVQRDLNPRKVTSLKSYILSGVKNNNVALRFFSAVTVSCVGFMFFDESNNRVAVDINTTRLSVNDGQHRYEAIKSAIKQLERDLVKAKDKEKVANITKWIDELSEMVIPVVIFNGLSEKEQSQLFYDLNNLAQRPSRNTNIRLNQTDLYSRMARELAEENRYLKHYGVEHDKVSISKGNPNTILLTTIYAFIKELLSYDNKQNKSFLNTESYEIHKKLVSDTLDTLFFVLPPDINIKGKYIIEKSYTLKAIARFICDARNHLDLQLEDDKIFSIIKEVNWNNDIEYWKKYGAFTSIEGFLLFAGGTNGGFRAVYKMLINKATNNDTSFVMVRGKGLVKDYQ